MTDSNATLLPCPFCGGEASKRLFYKGKYRVHCNVCDAHSGDVCDTEAEAIEAWNTRHVNTCTMSLMWVDDVDGECYKCSNCNGPTFTHGWLPDYCECCGAKVVG